MSCSFWARVSLAAFSSPACPVTTEQPAAGSPASPEPFSYFRSTLSAIMLTSTPRRSVKNGLGLQSHQNKRVTAPLPPQKSIPLFLRHTNKHARILYHAPRNSHLTQPRNAILFNVGHSGSRGPCTGSEELDSVVPDAPPGREPAVDGALVRAGAALGGAGRVFAGRRSRRRSRTCARWAPCRGMGAPASEPSGPGLVREVGECPMSRPAGQDPDPRRDDRGRRLLRRVGAGPGSSRGFPSSCGDRVRHPRNTGPLLDAGRSRPARPWARSRRGRDPAGLAPAAPGRSPPRPVDEAGEVAGAAGSSSSPRPAAPVLRAPPRPGPSASHSHRPVRDG